MLQHFLLSIHATQTLVSMAAHAIPTLAHTPNTSVPVRLDTQALDVKYFQLQLISQLFLHIIRALLILVSILAIVSLTKTQVAFTVFVHLATLV